MRNYNCKNAQSHFFRPQDSIEKNVSWACAFFGNCLFRGKYKKISPFKWSQANYCQTHWVISKSVFNVRTLRSTYYQLVNYVPDRLVRDRKVVYEMRSRWVCLMKLFFNKWIFLCGVEGILICCFFTGYLISLLISSSLLQNNDFILNLKIGGKLNLTVLLKQMAQGRITDRF